MQQKHACNELLGIPWKISSQFFIYVTVSAKTVPIGTTIEINFMA